MNKERAIYFAGLMEEYLNIPSCVCENIENELINEKYNKVINYVIDRRKELENKANYKTHQEIINMYLELQQENEQLKGIIKENTILVKDEYGDYQECNINPLRMKQKYEKLKDNWNKLKEYIKTEIPEDMFIDTEWFVSILDKMQELEQGSDSK